METETKVAPVAESGKVVGEPVVKKFKKIKKEEGKSIEGKSVEGKVTAPKEKKIKKVEPPPNPELKINGVPNPLLKGSHLKRALCVALAVEIEMAGKKPDGHANEIADCCRRLGVVKKLGFTEEKPEVDNLANNELSGMGYAKRTAIAFWEGKYHVQYADKVNECRLFAHEAMKAFHPELAAKNAPVVPVKEKKEDKPKEKKVKKVEKTENSGTEGKVEKTE